MTAAALPAPDYLKVEAIFAGTWRVIARRPLAYLALSLAYGVGPIFLIWALTGVSPEALGTASVPVRAASMALFVLGDGLLSAGLARLTFDAGASLKDCFKAPVNQLATFLLLAVVIDTPPLALNLLSGAISHETSVGLAFYALRFAVGTTIAAFFTGAAPAALAEGLGWRGALARAAALTAGHRWRVALFFAAFFVLKVLGPFLLANWGLNALATQAPLTVAVFDAVIWNLLACALGVSSALIYTELKRLQA